MYDSCMNRLARASRALLLTLAPVALACGGGEGRVSHKASPPPPAITLAVPATPPAAGAAPNRATKGGPPLPRTTASPSPSLSPPPPPSVTEPTPAPVAAPAVDVARVATLVGEGERALLEGRLAEATERFDEALTLDPGDARARAGKARAATTALGLKRTFVPDISSADGAEGRVKEMDDFDVDDLDVRRAAHIPGSTEIEATPARIKPGDTYKVQVYLRNRSKKKKRIINITDLKIHRVVNGRAHPLPASLMAREVPAKQRALVATLTGPWEDEVTSWVLDVQVFSEGGDVYQNRLVWK